nr:TrkA family potassium uptake protein [Spirochaetales bacterium]
MARQFALVGLGSFGLSVLEKLAEATDQIIILDKEKSVIEKYKDLAAKSYISDALNEEALRRIVPEGIDVAIVDVGDHLEAAIIVTNALKKLGAKQIIVRADSEDRGEILEMVGATRIIYPAKEAAYRIVPMLVSSSLFSFMPISASMVMAEFRVPGRYVGMTLIEANLRQTKGINVVALRKTDEDDYV